MRRIVARIYNSAVVWSALVTALRMGAAVLVLPLLLHLLTKEEFGVYYLFLRLAAFAPIIDFGFSITVGRHVSYAMGGATELRAHGLPPTSADAAPNRVLLWELMATYRMLYRYLSLIALVVLGVGGTYNIALVAANTTYPALTWAGWVVTVIATGVEIYFGWWNIFLRGMNQVQRNAQYAVFTTLLQLALSAVLLLAGFGLLSVPLASLVSNTIQRTLSRKKVLELLGERPVTVAPVDPRRALATIWPTTWRVGLQTMSIYLGSSLPALIFGAHQTAAFAEYGLSLQILSLCVGTSAAWTNVKWPLVAQLRSRHDFTALQELLRPRIALQTLTFVVMVSAAIILAPPALRWWGQGKSMMPPSLLWLMAINFLLEMHFAFWTTLLSNENRVPSLWPAVAGNVFSLGLFLWFHYFTSIGVAAMVIAPLISGLLFNYWYWPIEGARNLGTTWWRFTFGPKRR
jgi:hypothetical protein